MNNCKNDNNISIILSMPQEHGRRQVLPQILMVLLVTMEQKSFVLGKENTTVFRQTCQAVRTELSFVTYLKSSKKKA